MIILNNNEIKQCLIKMLLYFDVFCKNNNLNYYLVGGTLLGAVRHKGFIPWDDDIDVCMPRNDYQKLLSCYSNIENQYELRSSSLCKFDAPFSKLVDPRTVIDAKYTQNDIDTQLWIDIFPIDGLPDDILDVTFIYKKGDFYRKILILCDAKLGEGKTKIRRYLKFVLKPLANLYGKKRCVDNLERLAARYNYDECKYVGAITWGLYGVGERMLKSEFEQAVEVEFEGHKFPAFSCWDSYLRGLYGDYMKLPPLEKRKTHDMVAYLIEDEE